MDVRRILIGATIGMLGGVCWAQDYAEQWQQPLRLELPEATRVAVLRGGADGATWARRHGLNEFRAVSSGPQTQVQFPMSDEEWQARRDQLCSGDGVMACDDGACQGIQVNATAVNAEDPHAVQARIVRNPPVAEEIPQNAGGTCKVAALPPLETADPAAAADVELTLDLTDTEDDPGQAEILLQLSPDDPQGIGMTASDMPADTTDYTMQVAEGCRSISVPLSDVAPAHVPALIVALTAADPQVIAQRWGLTVVSSSSLDSTGETLAVFTSTQPIVQVLAALGTDPDILVSSREHIYTTSAVDSAAPSYSDPLASFTYGPGATGALALHGDTTGEGQMVAVIDTGVALEHPDLAGRVEHEDLTGRGWSADAHGTAVAAIIAAAADNAIGSYGVAPQAELLALKACQPVTEQGLQAKCWTSTLVKALDRAIVRQRRYHQYEPGGPAG